MSTLLAIDTHAGVSDFLPAMWPHYERAGVPIVGIERTNRPTRWPVPVDKIAVGEDLFQRWCEHKHPTLLCRRMLDSMAALLNGNEFSGYTDFCLSTWSVLFARPLPNPMPGSLILWKSGGSHVAYGFESPYFFHYPLWFDRQSGNKLLATGERLMAEGRTEKGANDLFCGLMVHEARMDWTQPGAGFTSNSMETDDYIREARAAIDAGALWVGNVKNQVELDRLWPQKKT